MRGPHPSSSSEARFNSLHQPRRTDQEKRPHRCERAEQEAAALNARCQCALRRRRPEVAHAERKGKKNGPNGFRMSTSPELLVLAPSPRLWLSVLRSVALQRAAVFACADWRRHVSPADPRAFRSLRIHQESSPFHLNLWLTSLRIHALMSAQTLGM